MPGLESGIISQEANVRYNPYGRFLKNRFGRRIYKVSVDGGFSCPNRDGTIAVGGCIYCNNNSFRPKTASRTKSISDQISEGIELFRRRKQAEKFIVYFQSYTNTHAPLDELIPLYETALSHPDVVGISIGTRPDCVDEEKLAWLEHAASEHFVTLEYGLQSIYDTSLQRIRRGHDFKCWLDAMRRTRGRGIWLGTHMILGFPWETREEMLHAADVISEQGVNFLKLHHLHIVRNTPLEEEYRAQPFPLLGLEEYTELVVDFLERLSPDIFVERLFGTSPKDQLVGPVWEQSKAEIRRKIEQRLISRDTYQGRKTAVSR